jgi:hypothetical protein
MVTDASPPAAGLWEARDAPRFGSATAGAVNRVDPLQSASEPYISLYCRGTRSASAHRVHQPRRSVLDSRDPRWRRWRRYRDPGRQHHGRGSRVDSSSSRPSLFVPPTAYIEIRHQRRLHFAALVSGPPTAFCSVALRHAPRIPSPDSAAPALLGKVSVNSCRTWIAETGFERVRPIHFLCSENRRANPRFSWCGVGRRSMAV